MRGRHITARLVEEPQARALPRPKRHAINRDAIFRADIEGRRVNHLAIHRNTALRNPGLCVPTRAKTNTRHHLGDALFTLGTFNRANAAQRLCRSFASHGAIAITRTRAKARPLFTLAERTFTTTIFTRAEAAFAATVLTRPERALAVFALAEGTFAGTILTRAEWALSAILARLKATLATLLTGFEAALLALLTRLARSGAAGATLLAEGAARFVATRLARAALVVGAFVGHAS